MGLIKQGVPPTTVEKIRMANTQCLNIMKMTARNTFNMLWNNPDKTAQEVCNDLGVDAGKAFDLHSNLQGLIYSIDNTWVPLVPLYPYVLNLDGSITITYPEPEPEPQGE